MTSNFTFAPHLSVYNLPKAEFDASRPEFTDFVTGAHIFSTSSGEPARPRVLLIQRAFSDSFGGCWEGAGGFCDLTDESLLKGAAREVFEETGFHVSRFVDLVSVDGWASIKPHGVRRAAKYTFIVKVHEQFKGEEQWEYGVKLDPAEHQAFMWVTEDEVRLGMQTGKLSFAGDQARNLFVAFEIFRKLQGSDGLK